MAYRIAFVGLSVQGDRGDTELVSGYQARAWLPGYDEQTFETETAAHEWIEANQRGPDLTTVEELFRVEEVGASQSGSA